MNKIGTSMSMLESSCSTIIPVVSFRTDFQRLLYSSGVFFTSSPSSSQSRKVSGTLVDSRRCKTLVCHLAFLKGALVAIFKMKMAKLWRTRRPRKMKNACCNVTIV